MNTRRSISRNAVFLTVALWAGFCPPKALAQYFTFNPPGNMTFVYGQPLTFPLVITPTGSGDTSPTGLTIACSNPSFTVSQLGLLPFPSGPLTVNVTGRLLQLGQVKTDCSILATGPGRFPDDLIILQRENVPITSFVSPLTFDATFGQQVGEPVSTASGELFERSLPPDLSLGGPLPVEFRRYYASFIKGNRLNTRIGNNWMHNFEWLLVITGTQARVIRFGAKTIYFNKSGANWQLANAERYGYQFASGPGTSYQFLDPRTNLIYTLSGTNGGLTQIRIAAATPLQ